MTNQERNWTEAEKFCNSEEGHLASVTSKEMHEFILEEVEKRKTKVWIGATDQESEGTWKWSDYSPFDFRGWIYNPDVDENVNCVELYNTIDGAGWNDLECGTPMHFVCASARHICPDTTRTSASSSYGSNCEASCVVSCPTGWERSGNRCYYWSKKSWSWNWFEAEDECRGLGAHLASVPKIQTHEFLQSKDIRGRWIGGIYVQENDTWVWSDCSPWDFNGWGNDGEPNGGDGYCARYEYYGEDKKDWEDIRCRNEKPFICSSLVCSENFFESQEEACNPDDCAETCDPGWEEFKGQCYFWSQEKLFWGAAEMKCRKLGGHLASVTSQDAHNFLHLHDNTPNSIWVGGTDQRDEGNWTWTDCSPWNYTKWGIREGSQQPDNSSYRDGDGENCLLFHGKNANNTDWNDVACNFKERRFICSKPMCPKEMKSQTVAADMPTAIIASITAVGLLLSIAVIVFFLLRRNKNVKEEVVTQGDENPVYGMYYFADREHIDYGSVEVHDDNEYYGT